MEKEHIVISIPTVGKMISVPLHAICVGLDRVNKDEKVPYRFSVNVIDGYFPVEHARNRLVQMFLSDETASRLWFFDYDVTPDEGVLDLLSVEGDIVAGTYPTWGSAAPGREPKATFAAYVRLPGKRGYALEKLPDDGSVMDVDGVLSGVTLIRRRVLEDPKMRYPAKYHDVMTGLDGKLKDDEPPPIYKTHNFPNGKNMISEDLDFCRRAKERGYSVKVHTGVRCGHLKRVDLKDVVGFADNTEKRIRAMFGREIDGAS